MLCHGELADIRRQKTESSHQNSNGYQSASQLLTSQQSTQRTKQTGLDPYFAPNPATIYLMTLLSPYYVPLHLFRTSLQQRNICVYLISRLHSLPCHKHIGSHARLTISKLKMVLQCRMARSLGSLHVLLILCDPMLKKKFLGEAELYDLAF